MRALGQGAERLLDLPGDRLELSIAVELVPEEIEHQRRPGLDLVHRFGQAGLVDLENSPVGPETSVGSCPLQRRGRGAEDQVGARAIRHHPMAGALEQPADQARGRGLTVRAGDDDRAVGQVLGQAGEDLRIDSARDVSGQRGAAAAPRDAAQRARGFTRPDSSGLSDHAQAGTARLTVVQQSSRAIASFPSCSVSVRLKNAEPLPVIRQPAPRFFAKSFSRGSTCSAARFRWFGASPLTSSHARYTSPVESSMPGHARANHCGRHGSDTSFSPRPSAWALPPTRKNGTSEPRRSAMGVRSRSRLNIAFRALSVAAASELAPPMPEPGGIRLWRWMRTGRARFAASSSASCAASTELFDFVISNPDVVNVVSFAASTSSTSWRSIAWKVVRSS